MRVDEEDVDEVSASTSAVVVVDVAWQLVEAVAASTSTMVVAVAVVVSRNVGFVKQVEVVGVLISGAAVHCRLDASIRALRSVSTLIFSTRSAI